MDDILKLVTNNNKIRVMIIYPISQEIQDFNEKFLYIKELIKTYGILIYKKKFILNKNKLSDLMKETYKYENYFKKDNKNKIQKKMELSYKDNMPTILLLIQFNSINIHENLQPFKELCRIKLNEGYRYNKQERRKFLHLTDNQNDTLSTCNYLFNFLI